MDLYHFKLYLNFDKTQILMLKRQYSGYTVLQLNDSTQRKMSRKGVVAAIGRKEQRSIPLALSICKMKQ